MIWTNSPARRRRQASQYDGFVGGNMGYLAKIKPLISTSVVFIASWLLVHVHQSFGNGIHRFAFLAITATFVAGIIHFVYRGRRPSESPSDLVENIPGLGWISESNGKISGMSSQMREFLKVPSGSLTVAEASIHPEDRYKTLDLWNQQHRSEKLGTHRLLGPDGRYHWFRSVVTPVRSHGGAVVASWGTFVEIGDLKAAEEALRSSEENLRSILDNIPENIVTADANGINDYCNRHSMEFYGSSFHEVNGSGFKRFIHPDDVEQFAADSLHVVANAIPMNQLVRQRRHDGVYRWFRIRVNPEFDENGKVLRWYGLHIDVDDEVKAREALQQVQDKLAQASEFASLAELAASIAHEVNQPLSAVVTNSEACQIWLSADPPNLERARSSADRIVRHAKESADVVRRIRELFAQKTPQAALIDINEVIEDVVHLVRKKHGARNLAVSVRPDASIPPLVADRIQIQQVVFNILCNGVEAMQSNGDQPMTLDIQSRLAAQSAIVEVTDNGAGLADPHKVFEPFFTTKTDGMGMGLSICRSIVDAHKGRIWAEARPLRGAIFAFELPLQDGPGLRGSVHDAHLPKPVVERI